MMRPISVDETSTGDPLSTPAAADTEAGGLLEEADAGADTVSAAGWRASWARCVPCAAVLVSVALVAAASRQLASNGSSAASAAPRPDVEGERIGEQTVSLNAVLETTESKRSDLAGAMPVPAERSLVDESLPPEGCWFSAIEAAQNDCARPVVDIDIQNGGGFASKFQWASAKAMAALRSGHRFRLVGHFGGYSNNPTCREMLGAEADSKGSYGCFFQAETRCGAGRSAGVSKKNAFASVAEDKVGELYDAVEAYMFRLNPRTWAHFREMAKAVGYPEPQDKVMKAPLLAMHMRRGDKATDKYNRLHTTEEYTEALRQLVLRHYPAVGDKSPSRPCYVYVASDDPHALGEVRSVLEGGKVGRCVLRVIGLENTATQQQSGAGKQIALLIAQQDGSTKYKMASEVIFDIHMLSRADHLIGTLASQIGRLAAGLKLATLPPAQAASSYHPVALDAKDLDLITRLSKKIGIPVSEGWTAPASQ